MAAYSSSGVFASACCWRGWPEQATNTTAGTSAVAISKRMRCGRNSRSPAAIILRILYTFR